MAHVSHVNDLEFDEEIKVSISGFFLASLCNQEHCELTTAFDEERE